MKKVLIVEDCEDSYFLIQMALSSFVSLTWARSLSEARLLIERTIFDLVVLDLNLPDGKGSEFCQQVRSGERFTNLPIVLLTADGDIESVVAGFEAGADDYITKPFNHRELRARIERRLSLNSMPTEQRFLRIGSITINKDMQKVETDKGTVDLTSIEFKILMLLATNPTEIKNRDEISQMVWDGELSNSRQVDTHVSRLRKKIGNDKIVSIHGRGYKLSS